MNFQTLTKVEKADTYIDRALHASSKRAAELRSQKKAKDRVAKSRTIELARIESFEKPITGAFNNIVKSYPDFDELPPFYQELTRATLDIDQLRKSLGAVNWARRQIQNIAADYKKRINQNKSMTEFNKIRTEFLGRAISVIRQVKKNLDYLEKARKVLKRFPAIKTSWYTVVIAGLPNVGKSTLLAALTGSKPEVAYYPFTTRNLNFGSDKENKIQYVDTPGLLDREKRNEIEEQAIIALKHIANIIIYVFDPTEACGYSMEMQKNVLKKLKQEFDVEVIKVANKADMSAVKINALKISAKEHKGIEELKKKILSAKDNWTGTEQNQSENTSQQQ